MKKTKLSVAVAILLSSTSIYAVELEEITISSATKSEQSIKDVTSNIEIISSDELEENNYKTLNEALSKIAGISVVSNGGMGTTSSVLVRGFSTNRLLVLVDGIRYNDPASISGGQFEHLLISDIEQIEVIKGAQSGVWGADASAGVINIITKKAKKGLYSSIDVSYGSFATKKTTASISNNTDKYSAKLSYGYINSNSFSAQAPNNTPLKDYEDDSYKNSTFKLNIDYHISDNNTISLNHTNIRAKAKYDGCYNKTWSNLYGGFYACSDNDIDKANSSTYYSDIDNDFSSIKFSNNNSLGNFDIYATRSVFDRSLNNKTHYIGGAKDNTIDSTKLEFDGQADEFGATYNIPYNKTSFVLLGTSKQKFEHKNSFNKKYQTDSIFITNSSKINNNNTILTQSIRHSDNDAFKNKTTGKIGIKQYIKDDLSLSANYGTAFTMPTIYQMYDPSYGNENTKPETTKGYDLSINFKGFTANYFHNKITDLISYHPVTYKTINKDGKTTLKGYELKYNDEVLTDIIMNVQYTRLKTLDADGKTLIRRPQKTLDVSFDYYGIKDLHLNINGSYVGDARDEYWDSNLYQSISYTRKSYSIFGCNANYSINKKLYAYVKIENITNRYYQNAYGYSTSPRAYYTGIKYEF
jgi:vitamin B12 transporter